MSRSHRTLFIHRLLTLLSSTLWDRVIEQKLVKTLWITKLDLTKLINWNIYISRIHGHRAVEHSSNVRPHWMHFSQTKHFTVTLHTWRCVGTAGVQGSNPTSGPKKWLPRPRDWCRLSAAPSAPLGSKLLPASTSEGQHQRIKPQHARSSLEQPRHLTRFLLLPSPETELPFHMCWSREYSE